MSGIDIETSAFEKGFSKEANLSAWAKVGAAPLTRACLWDKKVCRELGDEDDKTNQFISHLQESNWNAVAFLNRRGYEGKHLQATIIKARKETPVTVAHSKERMILLAKAKTHGEKFTAT